MKVPFWSPAREYENHKDEIDSAIRGCLSRGELVLGFGDEITRFEKSFAALLGAKHCIAVGAGSHALNRAYKALLKPGDEVITTSHTFIATINQIAEVGAVPVLVDVGEDGLIDPWAVEEAITPRTRAIVPVHLEGKACDMGRIMEIARKYQLEVIEDACQAITAKHAGRHVGTFGRVGCFSFHPAKVLGTIGNAGAIVTDDDALADELRLSRCHHNVGKEQIKLESGREVGPKLSGNYKPDPVLFAVLNAKLPHLAARLARRKEVAERYGMAFSKLNVTLPVDQESRIWQDYVLLCADSDEKEKLVKRLGDDGIGVLGHDIVPNHKVDGLKLTFSLPRTEDHLARQVRIPCNPDMTDEEVEHVIESVSRFYRNV